MDNKPQDEQSPIDHVEGSLKADAQDAVDNIKDSLDKAGAEAEQDAKIVIDKGIRHPAHEVLDEFEQHLSQFDSYSTAVYHSFLRRLRNLI